MSFLLLVFLYNSIIAETRPLWDFFLPLRTVGLHFGESRNTSYALRRATKIQKVKITHCASKWDLIYFLPVFFEG